VPTSCNFPAQALSQRPQMPPGARLVSWQPKAAPVRLSRCTTVTDVERFIGVTLAQLAAHSNGKHWVGGNWGLQGLLARLEACGCVVKLDNPKRVFQ
jgi:hypothetical protein